MVKSNALSIYNLTACQADNKFTSTESMRGEWLE